MDIESELTENRAINQNIIQGRCDLNVYPAPYPPNRKRTNDQFTKRLTEQFIKIGDFMERIEI